MLSWLRFYMINAKIGNARITLAFFYDEAECVSFNSGERFNSLMADRSSPGNGRPFSVQACFYPVSADSFSLSNVFLNNVIVGLRTFPGFQGQCFLVSAGLGQRFFETSVDLLSPFLQTFDILLGNQAFRIGSQTDNQCRISSY